MKKIRTLIALLCALACLVPGKGTADSPGRETFVYGESALGRDLECIRIGPDGAATRFLAVFAVHGFEDRFIRDGALLTETALALADALERGSAVLPDGCAVYIVPCANPDGLLDGFSNTGFGRCNADGLDINRDFPEGWVRRTTPANRTGDAPFATPEARALRDLVLSVSPDYAVDVHGYVNRVKYSSRRDMARFFASDGAMDMPCEKWQSGGMLCAWLDTVTDGALLIELPSPLKNGDVNVLKEGYVSGMAAALQRAIVGWLAEAGR